MKPDNVIDRIIAFLPRLRRFAYALTGNLDDGDDLVQDTIVKAMANLDKWQPDTSLESWMFRIGQNVWIDKMRREAIRGETAGLDVVHQFTGIDGRSVTEARSDLLAISKGVQMLPTDQKVLVALVCVDGLSYKQAAEILDLPIGTVMSRLSRARRVLADIIQPDRLQEFDENPNLKPKGGGLPENNNG